MTIDTFKDEIPTLEELAELCEHSTDHTLYDLALYADLLEQSNQPENAIIAYRNAIALCDTAAVDNRFHQDLLVSLGRLLTDGRQYDEASERLREAVEIADQRVGDHMRRYSAYDALAAFHTATGDEAEAVRCHAIAEPSAHAAAAKVIDRWQRNQKPNVVIAPAKQPEWEAMVQSMTERALRMPTEEEVQCLSALAECGAFASTEPVPLDHILATARKQGGWTLSRLRGTSEKALLRGFLVSRERSASRNRPHGLLRDSTGGLISAEGSRERTYALAAPVMELLARIAAGLVASQGVSAENRQRLTHLVAALKLEHDWVEVIHSWVANLELSTSE